MPFYDYWCKQCEANQEIYFKAPPPEMVLGGQCTADGKECIMERVWSKPGIGYIDGLGFSPARQTGRNST